MKTLFSIGIVMACLIIGASAQTAPPAPSSAPAQGNAASEASGGGKRVACQAAVQGMKGQERRDQMQLCLTQARVDCLKQAIDQKLKGPQRHDFVRSCVGTDGKPERSDE